MCLLELFIKEFFSLFISGSKFCFGPIEKHLASRALWQCVFFAIWILILVAGLATLAPMCHMIESGFVELDFHLSAILTMSSAVFAVHGLDM